MHDFSSFEVLCLNSGCTQPILVRSIIMSFVPEYVVFRVCMFISREELANYLHLYTGNVRHVEACPVHYLCFSGRSRVVYRVYSSFVGISFVRGFLQKFVCFKSITEISLV